MQLQDFLITIPFLALLFWLAVKIRNKSLRNTEVGKYFVLAIAAKVIGAFALAGVSQFYYSEPGFRNDTFGIYQEGEIISDALRNDPAVGVKILLSDAGELDMVTHPYVKQFDFYYYRETDTFFLAKIISILNILTFNNYIAVSILFALFSFIGTWALFRTFVSYYPKIHFKLATSILFFPSVIFWGSGLLKDSIVLGSIGLLIYGFDQLFNRKKIKFLPILLTVLSIILIAKLKPYVLIVLLPFTLFWVYQTYLTSISSKMVKFSLTPLLLLLFGLALYFVPPMLGKEFNQYSFEQLTKTMHKHNVWNSRQGQGSAYSFGDVPESTLDFIKKVPAAITVTLFRPFPWEVKNILMLVSSLESLGLFILTLFALYIAGLRKFFKSIYFSPMLIFCLGFTIVFAYWIGLSTYNFGALSRYRIPCLPFYLSALFIIMHDAKHKFVGKMH